MKNFNNDNQQQSHIADPKEIWGVDFFWTKNLKFDEKEIKKATEKAMHPEDVNHDQSKRQLH